MGCLTCQQGSVIMIPPNKLIFSCDLVKFKTLVNKQEMGVYSNKTFSSLTMSVQLD